MAYDKKPMNYTDLIYRHLDRMSESLKHGLEVGQINNATFLMAYYLFIRHFESMINIYISGEELRTINEYKSKRPSFKKAYSGSLRDNIDFIDGISDWFEVLLLVANNESFIKIGPIEYKEEDDFAKIGQEGGSNGGNTKTDSRTS